MSHASYNWRETWMLKTAWWRHQMETLSALPGLCVGIHRSLVNSPHKGQWRGVLMFSLICAETNGHVNNRDAGNFRRHRAHYDVTVMIHRSFYCHHTLAYDKVHWHEQNGWHFDDEYFEMHCLKNFCVSKFKLYWSLFLTSLNHSVWAQWTWIEFWWTK